MHSTMGSRQIGWCLAMVLLLWGCGSQEFESKAALMAYLHDPGNGYHLTEHVNGVDYALTYRPTDLLVAQELPDNYKKSTVDSLRNHYGDYLYLNLSMSAGGQELLSHKAGDRAAFGAMVNQLAFGMGSKIHLVNQVRDTLPLLDYVYPRMYGMGHSTDLLLVYKKEPRLIESDFVRLTIADLGYGTGEIAFKMPTKNFIEQPELKF
ncbi:MAG: hypothetical protein AAGF77_07790 [Bacteroidota bacterium]